MNISNVPTRKQNQIFFKLYFMCIGLMVINFFLTPNPFSALHSGRTLAGYYTISDSFIVAPAYLVVLSMGMVLLLSKQVLMNYKVLIMAVILIVSGLHTEAITTNFSSYVYNTLALILIASVSLSAYFKSDGEIEKLIRIVNILTVIMVLGIVLAILFPYRFGYLPFEFSRYSRGEITLWNVTGLFAVYPTLALLIYMKYQKKLYLILAAIMIIVVLSTASRADVTLAVMPILIFLMFRAKLIYKFFIGLFAVLTLPFFMDNIIKFFMGVNTNYGSDISNGRFELWGFHLDTALKHPFLGAGAFFMNKTNVYNGSAQSEVGALMWFSENGIVFGIIMLSFVISALYVAIKLLIKGKEIKDTEFFFSVIFIAMLPNLIQSYGRILSIQDVLFWFSMFYLNWHLKPKIPYINVFKKKKFEASNQS